MKINIQIRNEILGNCDIFSKSPDVWFSVRKLLHHWHFLFTSGCSDITDSLLFISVKYSFLVMILENRVDVKKMAMKQIIYLLCITQATYEIV